MSELEIRLRPTEAFFMHGAIMVRAWRGTTQTGADVIALISAVTAAENLPSLVSIPPPTPDHAQAWARVAMEKYERRDE